MSDETEQREAEQQETPDPAGTDGTEGGSSEQKQEASKQQPEELEKLRVALKTANDEAAQRRHQIKKLEEQIKASERSGMDETERLKAELADLQAASTERDQLKAKAEALETAVGGQVEALLKELDVPGHIQELLEPMGAAEKLSYLAKNRQAFAKPEPEKKKPDIDAGSKGGGKAAKRDRAAIRARFGI